MKHDEIRKELCAVLKAQEKESKRLRRSKDPAYTDEIWDQLNPKKRVEVLKTFAAKGALSDLRLHFSFGKTRERMWENLHEEDIATLINKDVNSLRAYFDDFTKEQQKSFLSSEYYSCRSELLSACKGKEEKIFSVVAELPHHVIADILARENNSEVVCLIFKHLPKEEIFAVCNEMENEKLYPVLERGKFAMFKNEVNMYFPVEKLSNEEKIKLASSIERVDTVFDVITLAEIYEALDADEKEKVLSNILADFSKLRGLYCALDKTAKMDTLEILAKQHTEELKLLLEERKEELNFFEKTVFDSLS